MVDKYTINNENNSVEVYGSLIENNKVIVNYNDTDYIFHSNDSQSINQVARNSGNKLEENPVYQKISINSGPNIIKTDSSVKLMTEDGYYVYKDLKTGAKESFDRNNIDFSFSVYNKGKNDKDNFKRKSNNDLKYHTKKTITRLIPGSFATFFIISGLILELIFGFSILLSIVITLYIVYSTAVLSYFFSRFTSMKILKNTFGNEIDVENDEKSTNSIDDIKDEYKNNQITEEEFEDKLEEFFRNRDNKIKKDKNLSKETEF